MSPSSSSKAGRWRSGHWVPGSHGDESGSSCTCARGARPTPGSGCLVRTRAGGRAPRAGCALFAAYLHEEPIDADSHRGARDRRDELTQPAGGARAVRVNAAARQLERVGHVGGDEAAWPSHPHEVAHVDYLVRVAERRAAFACDRLLVARDCCLVRSGGHHGRIAPLPLLDVEDAARLRRRRDEVRLPAQEGRDLQHVSDLCDGGRLLGFVNVGHDGHTDVLLDRSEDLEAGREAWTAERRGRRPVGLVEARLEDELDAEARRYRLSTRWWHRQAPTACTDEGNYTTAHVRMCVLAVAAIRGRGGSTCIMSAIRRQCSRDSITFGPAIRKNGSAALSRAHSGMTCTRRCGGHDSTGRW
eukprot:3608788-Prymnesium_polylepis.1